MRDLLLIFGGIAIGSMYWKVRRDLDLHRQYVEDYVDHVVADMNETVTDIHSGIERAIDESDDFKRKFRNSRAML